MNKAPTFSSIWQDDLDLIGQAALAAGEIAMSYFRNDVEVFWKNDGRSPVSAADFAANDAISEILKAARPDYGWLSEETEDDARRLHAERLFIIDPIDGTRAFINGTDFWCVSIAVVAAGKPVAGVLFAPALAQTYLATADGVLTKNGIPFESAALDATRRMRVTGCDQMFAKVPPISMSHIERLKNVPSLAYRLAMVADGQLDATLVRANSHDWDIAAAHLILTNAGGRLEDASGAVPIYNRSTPVHPALCGASLASADRMMPLLGTMGDY